VNFVEAAIFDISLPMVCAIWWWRIDARRPPPTRADRALHEPLMVSLAGFVVWGVAAAVSVAAGNQRLGGMGGAIGGWLIGAGGWFMVLEPANRYARRDAAAIERQRRHHIVLHSTFAQHLRSYRHTGWFFIVLGTIVFLYAVG
jgi:hypothetical protein